MNPVQPVIDTANAFERGGLAIACSILLFAVLVLGLVIRRLYGDNQDLHNRIATIEDGHTKEAIGWARTIAELGAKTVENVRNLTAAISGEVQ